MTRNGLILLQALGGLTILAYPFILLANIMSIAAPGQTRVGVVPFVLLCFYPIVWIALYFISWRAMARGATGLAFGLSSVPALSLLGVFGLYIYGWVGYAHFIGGPNSDARRKIEPINPLLWAIWSTGGDTRFPPGPAAPVAQALLAIDANPGQVNLAVPPYGSPLKVAVDNLALDFGKGTVLHPARQQELTQVVRSLVAHGAHFAADEISLRDQWKLRLALHDGPITTIDENPLVWRIVTRQRDGSNIFALREDEIPLANRSTTLHGTPLYAALVVDAPDAVSEVIKAGGHLSTEEARDPAAAATLEQVFAHDPGLRQDYTKTRQ